MNMGTTYDRVDWDFVEATLLKLGFYESWVRLVMEGIDTVMLNICLSRRKVASIISGRGLRQGDPLYPYIFIIMVEVFPYD